MKDVVEAVVEGTYSEENIDANKNSFKW